MRLAVALRTSVRATWVLGASGLVLVAMARIGWLTPRAAAGVFGAALALAALAVVIISARSSCGAASAAAARADEALGLFDRMTSAVAFLDEPSPTPLMLLAIEDGARISASIDPSRVVALSLPRSTRAMPLLGLAIGAAFLLHPPRRPTITIAPDDKPRLVVDKDALDAERAALRKLARERRGKDPGMAQLAEDLDKILDEIDRQKLSRAEAFDKLAALEQKVNVERANAAPPPKKELEALQKALASSKETKPIADALKKDDLDAAKQALEKLAAEAEARAEKGDGNKQQDEAQRELSRALDRASKALDEAQKKADAERDKQIDELKEEERRLKREHEEHPDDEETERRLQRNQRELERLEREKEQQQEQRRQLQRLSRELEKAAEQLRQKMSPEAMKRAAEELGKMEDEIRKLGSSAQQQMQIVELKEVLRRAGRVEQGNGQNGKGQGQSGKGPNGKGQNGSGQGNERDEQLRQFDKRAGGEPNALLLGGDDPGQGSVMLPLPMAGGGNDPGGGKDPGDQQGRGNGDDIGKEHDPNVTGDPTHLDAQKKLIHAKGQAGAGPSKSQTILGASERGFSSRDYSRVYKDYTSVVEEVMSQERVPPGYRYYVKRYFQLIRPRE